MTSGQNGSFHFEFISASPEITRSFGRLLGENLCGGEVILLSGPLGAGKTTLVQGIALGLGITGGVKSPSFVLERDYRGRLNLRHFDFYRLSREETEEAGFLSEMDECCVTVVEWAERAGDMEGFTLKVKIGFLLGKAWADNLRRISVETPLFSWGKIVENSMTRAQNEGS